MTTTEYQESVWYDRNEWQPSMFARIYSDAASIISERGYQSHPEGFRFDSSSGAPESASSAIDAACLGIILHDTEPRPAGAYMRDVEDLADAAHERLAGFLLMAAPRSPYRTRNVDDAIISWDRDPIRRYAATSHRYHTADEAIAMLEQAARCMQAIPDGEIR